ncbi:MAG: hypothetical protein Fur0041_06950 [Bacteroidia bacterium]
MKKFAALAMLGILFFSFQAAQSWIYINPESVKNLEDYTTALSKCDLDKYRYMDKRNTLHFESGLDVQLLSANEMIAKGMQVKLDRVRTTEPEFDTKPLFRLTESGHIVEMLTRNKIK